MIKAALSHVQFETIHPFLDGNGRVGRLLITLLLCEGKVLKQPLLYLSYYFKLHRQYYYELLNSIRNEGDWERWLEFFAEAIIATARQSLEIIIALDKQVREDREKIQGIGKGSKSATLVHQVMLRHPIASPLKLKEETKLTDATINASLRKLQELGIAEETTGQKRNRLFCYHNYFQLLNQKMELPE